MSDQKLDNLGSTAMKKVRSSNLELFRIISMLLIIAHHYVVNSGLSASDGPLYTEALSVNSVIMFLFGAWGKTGINCFLMITGYFMCTSQITAKNMPSCFWKCISIESASIWYLYAPD